MKGEIASLDGRNPDDRVLARAAAWMGWGTLAWYAGALLGAWVLPWTWRSALGEAGSTAGGRWLLMLIQTGVVFAGPCLLGYATRRWRRVGGGPFRGRVWLALESLAVGAASLVVGTWAGWVGTWCFWLGAILAWIDFGGRPERPIPARYWCQHDRLAYLIRWNHDLRVLDDLSAMPPGPDRDAAWAAGLDAANRVFSWASRFFQSPSAIRTVWTLWKEEADAAAEP